VREYVPGLTNFDIDAAKELIIQALHPGAIRTPEELQVLAILEAYISLVQQAKGRRSKGKLKEKAERRRCHVNLLLRYKLENRLREAPTGAETLMKLIEWLDILGIEASVTQVRRDVQAVLSLGPLA